MNMTEEQIAALRAKIGAKSGNVRLSNDEVDERLVEGIMADKVTSKSGAYLWFREEGIPCSRPRVLESWDRLSAIIALPEGDEDETDEDSDEVVA
jgi:rRNA pseudouridine-1189 N-methylase Emg1 (Nep1/Mra1 family)